MKEKNKAINCIEDDKGFSLVEMIVAVAILAIIFTPILRNFTTASLTNKRAQKIQNATSLSEDIMEEIKSHTIEQLYDIATDKGLIVGSDDVSKDKIDFIFDYKNAASDAAENRDGAGFDKNKKAPYKIVFSDVTATQGQKYDAVVTIDPSDYSQEGTEDTDTDDVSNINKVKLPKLYDIQDSKDHAVLSWELNMHDETAAKNLAEENADESDSTKNVGAIISKIRSDGVKTTTITLSGSSDIEVVCNVKYEIEDGGKYIEYNVYTGNLKHIDKDDKNSGGPHVYLFYGMMPVRKNGGTPLPNMECFPNEIINIVDNTTDVESTDSSKRGTHNVYLMLQDADEEANQKVFDMQYLGSNSTLEVDYNGSELVKKSSPAYKLSKTQWDLGGGKTLFTNFKTKGTAVTAGHLYEEKEKDRVYQVTVTTYMANDDDRNNPLSKLTSTISAGAEADE